MSVEGLMLVIQRKLHGSLAFEDNTFDLAIKKLFSFNFLFFNNNIVYPIKMLKIYSKVVEIE